MVSLECYDLSLATLELLSGLPSAHGPSFPHTLVIVLGMLSPPAARCTVHDAAAEIGHIFSHALLLDPEMQQLSISNTGSRARLDRALQKLREGAEAFLTVLYFTASCKQSALCTL